MRSFIWTMVALYVFTIAGNLSRLSRGLGGKATSPGQLAVAVFITVGLMSWALVLLLKD